METILIPGAEIYYDKNFLSPEEATTLFNLLRTKCAWERRKSSFQYAVPRDEADYGDPGTGVSEYQGDIFAAEHGSWNRSVRAGYELIRVPLHLTGHASGEYEDFMTGVCRG